MKSILFTDRFAEVSTHSNVVDWVGLETGRVANNLLFCEGVQEAFEGKNEAYDKMLFLDDKVLSDLHHINFRKVVPHSWKKNFEQRGRA